MKRVHFFMKRAQSMYYMESNTPLQRNDRRITIIQHKTISPDSEANLLHGIAFAKWCDVNLLQTAMMII